jgi:hypothetical protein
MTVWDLPSHPGGSETKQNKKSLDDWETLAPIKKMFLRKQSKPKEREKSQYAHTKIPERLKIVKKKKLSLGSGGR